MTEILSVDRLEKSYGALKATDGVSLTVKAGEIHALIGPNGAGKTTLISQIYGSLKPDGGAITLMGEDITGLATTERIRRGMARSFQVTSVLMGFTAAQNIMLAEYARRHQAFRFFAPAFADSDARQVAEEALGRVGLGAQCDALVATLSHGERRLLEMALAAVLRPVLMLLDEPMAGVGGDESTLITAYIASLRDGGRDGGVDGCGILLIEHDMDAVFRLADRITVLVEGRVIASGTAAEISTDAAVREAYLGAAV